MPPGTRSIMWRNTVDTTPRRAILPMLARQAVAEVPLTHPTI